jgi:nitroreductase
METWDAISARRNVRSYPPDAVPAEHLTRIAEAGWRAPSASNRQHGDFIVVTDRGSAGTQPFWGRSGVGILQPVTDAERRHQLGDQRVQERRQLIDALLEDAGQLFPRAGRSVRVGDDHAVTVRVGRDPGIE